MDPIAGGVAVFTSPSSPVNKMIGVGFEGVPSDEALAAVEEKFRARGAPLQAEVSTLAATAFGATLSRRGYVLQGFENVLGRRLDADDAEATEPEGFEVRLIEAREVDAWLDVSITGFASPDLQGVPAEPLPPARRLSKARFASSPLLPAFAATGPGWAGAWPAARACDWTMAWPSSAEPLRLPEFRRRGIQSAFLRRRLADAVAAGCDLALVTTQPGSKSQQNSQQQGFALLYSRALLVKPPA